MGIDSRGRRWHRGIRLLLPLSLVYLLIFPVAATKADTVSSPGDIVCVTKPDSGTTNAVFQVSLSSAPSQSVTVNVFTSDGTATAGKDYVATSGTVLFRPGETRKSVIVPVIGNTIPEGDRSFFLNLSGGGRATGVIFDPNPVISISGVTLRKPESGLTNANFVVSLLVPAAPGIPPGATTTNPFFPPGTVLSSPCAPQGVQQGARTFGPVSVSFATADGTAVAGTHYVATSGTLVFAPGETSKVIQVPVIGNLFPDRDRYFFVAMFNPSRGQISSVQASATIISEVPVAFTGEPPAASVAPGGPIPPGGLPSGLLSVASTGEVVAAGDGPTYHSAPLKLNQPAVGAAGTRSRKGYWLTASDGGVFAFGDAQFFGSTGDITLNRPIVGMAPTPSGNGYWLTASDGGVFAFGDAQFFGSTGDITLNRPIVGMTATRSGNGYWLVASDGGIFAFGDAQFFGSPTGLNTITPVVGMAATPSGHGYWLATAHGGVFNFGDAQFFGSTSGIKLNQPVVGMAATASGNGYWLMARDGGLFAFGDAPYFPVKPEIRPDMTVVGITTP